MCEILINSFVNKSKIGKIGELNVHQIYQYGFEICELNHLQQNCYGYTYEEGSINLHDSKNLNYYY